MTLKSSVMQPLTLVFDVGMVLIGADYEPFLAFMRAHGADTSDIEEFCVRVDLDGHERGDVDALTFMQRLSAVCTQKPEPAELLKYWNSFYFPDLVMTDFVRRAATRQPVYLLSNMGALHWDHLEKAFGIPSLGHGAVASYTVGAIKPHPTIYETIEQRFNLDPARTVFIDDRPVNIAAAKERGWAGIVHRDATQTLQALAQLGVDIS